MSQFPLLYHAHHDPHREDLPFWLSVANANEKRQSGPILELGCGTGRILIPLARVKNRVYGLDRDLAMLQFLSTQIGDGEPLAISLIQADMRRFHFGARFGLILLPCNTLSTFRQNEIESLFACVSRHLAPGGLFVASLPNPALLLHMPEVSELEYEETFLHPSDDQPVQVSSAWQHDQKTFEVTWLYEHRLPDQQIERIETRVRQFIHPITFYIQALEGTGLNSIQLYGGYDRRQYRKSSTDLIIVAGRTISE